MFSSVRAAGVLGALGVEEQSQNIIALLSDDRFSLF